MNVKKAHLVLLAAAAVFVLIPACDSGSDSSLSTAGENCTKTTDCESGLKCVGSICVDGDQPIGEDVQGDNDSEVCEPQCEGKACGDDGCGGSCGECETYCIEETKQCCIPQCKDKECGDDGCGGTCGSCEEHYDCEMDSCVYVSYCGDGTCDANEDCTTCAADCACSGCGETCVFGFCTFTACAEKECGDDGCGGTCAPGCGGSEMCQSGQCSPDYGDEVLIPAGNFWMGCNEAVDAQCESDERPYHQVYLDAYYIDVTLITLAAYGECVTAGVCTLPDIFSSICNWGKADEASHPVNCVTWFQAVEYCEWVGKRLPTEAEWEKAARGTDGRKYPWGNETATCDYAIMYEYSQNGCGTENTWPVCSKSPAGDSPYGLCDMAGNVWEWTRDWHSSSYYSSSPVNNPAGPESGSYRAQRGGGFLASGDGIRASSRAEVYPSYPGFSSGARCARDAP